MNPGITLMPFASMVFIPWAFAAPAAAETILPPRMTTEPELITWPLPTIIRALVIARSCATRGAAATVKRKTRNVTPGSLLILLVLRLFIRLWPFIIPRTGQPRNRRQGITRWMYDVGVAVRKGEKYT